MPFSDTTIRTAKPKEKLYRLTDAKGLCLEVTQTGSKLWLWLWRYRYRYRYRFNCSAKMLALGAYPAVTLLKTHQMRDESRQLLIEDRPKRAEKKRSNTLRRSRG